MSKKIVVIGGGPAGVEAALAAAGEGAAVTIVSNAPLGGRAGWHSLLPSKVWLTAADTMAAVAHSGELGLTPVETAVQPGPLLDRLHQMKQRWNGQLADAVQAAGITVMNGTAHFADPHQVIVTDKEDHTEKLSADAFIVTAGSVPIFPPEMKPDGKRVIAPRFASGLKTIPRSAIVVGGGVTGTEFVYLFNRLGVDVTWVIDQFGILPSFDPAAGEAIRDLFRKRGVQLLEGAPAAGIERSDDGVTVQVGETGVAAEMAFLAIGRRPDLSGLQLTNAGLELEKGAVPVDPYGRSTQAHIYLAGDVTGNPMVANRAMAQAWAAGKHAAGGKTPPFRPESVVSAVYSAPQVAQVGSLAGRRARLSYGAAMKPHLGEHAAGFIEMAVAEDGRLLGALAVGDHAADLLAPVAVAIQAGMDAAHFGALYAAHPTVSELAFMVARQFN